MGVGDRVPEGRLTTPQGRAPLERLTDAQRSVLLLDLLSGQHYVTGNGTPPTEKMMAARTVFLTEVADGTGFARGYADALALSLWKSDGWAAHGYEIKASRADLKRELAQPDKWQRIGRYCTRWTLVVWDRRWLEDDGIPATWGLQAYDADEAELVEVRRPKALTPEPWSQPFVAALIRRAAEAAPSAALLERVREIGYGRGASQARREAEREEQKQLEPLRELYRASGRLGASYANHVPLEWAVGELQRLHAAVRELQQLHGLAPVGTPTTNTEIS